MNDLHQPLWLGCEIGVEDGDKLAGGDFQAGVERARLIAFAVGAMVIADVVAQRGVALDHAARHFDGFVGGVVEHLNLQLLARILELADAVHQPIDDVLLVEDGQLDGDLRQLRKARFRIGDFVLAVLVVQINQLVTMHAVERQQHQHHEVGNQQRHVEGVGVVQAFERGVEEMGPKIMAQPMRLHQ